MALLIVNDRNQQRSIPFEPGQLLSEILQMAGQRLPSACAGSGVCGLCLVRLEDGAVSELSEIERKKLTAGQIQAGYRYGCQTRVLGDSRIAGENLTPLTNWYKLGAADYSPFSPPATVRKGATAAAPSYGVAVDLGTTQLRLTVWDMHRGQRLGGLAGTNPQSVFGGNVLSRLAEARDSEAKALELGRLVRNALGEALADVAKQEGVDLRSIREMVVVGNTAMLSLFSGVNYQHLLQPEHWTREITCRLPDSVRWAQDWGLADDARMELIQPLGGFVGADLLANVLASRLLQRPPGSLLVDVGTNTELALWDGLALWVTSTPGGCAFDGYGVMPAQPGAVYRMNEGDGMPGNLSVIGGGKAKGVCGSGMVDFIALLLESGKINRQGRFTVPVATEGFPLSPELPGITLRKRDVDSFQRGKAAMAAAIRFLLRQAGLKLHDIRHLYVSGTFGRFLQIDHAQRVGLLPTIPADRIELVGNAALAGCEQLLFAEDPSESLADIRDKANLINLAESPEFEDLFIDHLFLQAMSENQ